MTCTPEIALQNGLLASPLREEDVLQLRERAAQGERSLDLAQEFGLSFSGVRRVLRGETWKHVGGPRAATGRVYARKSPEHHEIRAALTRSRRHAFNHGVDWTPDLHESVEDDHVQRMALRARSPEEKLAARREYNQAYNAANRTPAETGGPNTRNMIVRLIILEHADGACGICGEDVDPMNFEVDHVIPISRGGAHHLSNLQPAHRHCNRVKHARLPEEMD